MRVGIAVVICTLTAAGVASAQAPAAGESKGYVEAVAQSAFGNVTSQSFGVEAGVAVSSGIHVFVEAGKTRDTSPSSLGTNAQLIAGVLSQTQSNVGFSVRQPATFGVGGLRYVIPSTATRVEPYIMGGFGVARIKKDVSFTVGGTDVTNNLQQYQVVLGTDLTGSETKPMFTLGLGVAWPAWEQVVVDFQYRYGRVFTSGEGLNINRAGVGLGIRF